MATSLMGATANTPSLGLMNPSNVLPKGAQGPLQPSNPFSLTKTSPTINLSTPSNSNAQTTASTAGGGFYNTNGLGAKIGQGIQNFASGAVNNFLGANFAPYANAQTSTVVQPPKPSITTPTNYLGSQGATNTSQSAPATTGYVNPFMGASGTQNTQTVQSPSTSQSPQNNGLFGQAIYNLSNTQPNQTTTAANQSLLGQANGQNPANQNIQNLQNIAQNGSPEVQQIQRNIAGMQDTQNELATNPNMLAEVASGRAQGVGNQIGYAQQRLTNALAAQGQQITAGQAAGGQQLTGQQQQIGAAQNAGGLANTAQANQITGQTNAAGNAFNNVAQNGYVLINKATGQPVQGGSAGSAAFQGGQIEAQNAQGTQSTQMTSALQQGQNLGSQLKDLISTFNINPNDINAVNSGIQAIARNTSSTQYKALENLVTDIVATYSQILTPGSSTDTARATAASLLDASAKGSSIITALNSLDSQAQAKIAGVPTGGASGNTGSQFTGEAWK